MKGYEIIKLLQDSRRDLYGYDNLSGCEKNESWRHLEDIGLYGDYAQKLGEIALVESTKPEGFYGEFICVWHFKDHDVYIKGQVDEGSQGVGYKLDSYDLKQVYPKQVDMTMYEERAKLTAEEILKRLEESGFPVEVFAYNEVEDDLELPTENGETEEVGYEEGQKRYDALIESLGGCEQVAQKGGQGQGDEWYSVKYFPVHDVYIRTDGWYTSYHGTDFENGFGKEVKPETKVVTVYE